MMKALAIAACAVAAAAAAARAAEPQTRFSVAIPDLQQDARVMAFSFRILGGQVAGFGRVPAGWQITVSNDPSWTGSVKGQAIVGTAALNQLELQEVFTISQPPATAATQPLAVSGSITTILNGEESTRPFRSMHIQQATQLP